MRRSAGVPTKFKETLQRYDFRIKKRWGQNFLIDKNIQEIIIKSACLKREDFVFEIGAGFGELTRALSKGAGKVIALEVDKDLVNILRETLADCPNLKVIAGDVLKINLEEVLDKGYKWKIVANLPYYITTPIINRLLVSRLKLKSLILMLQREVAERILAHPGTKAYGALSILVQYHTHPELILRVKKTCFYPQPEVDSALIKLKPRRVKVKIKDESLFFSLVKASFQMRRKTLSNALVRAENLSFSKEEIEKVLSSANIDPRQRGETLSLEEFGEISNLLSRLM